MAPSRFLTAFPLVLLLALAGCTTERQTLPETGATEQLLISTAAERAAESLAAELPDSGSFFLESYGVDGQNTDYALAAVRDRLLRKGMNRARNKQEAERVIVVRVGALSVDQASTLVGLPGDAVPIPLTGDYESPELALFKKENTLGVAKLAATAYNHESGELELSAGPAWGFSRKTEWTVLIFISWTEDDIRPRDARPDILP